MKRLVLLIIIFTFHSSVNSEPADKVNHLKKIVLEYTVLHSFKKVTGVCKTPIIEGLEIDFKSGEYEILKPFSISCDFKNLKSGNNNRDSHMLEILNYPKENLIQIQILKTERKSQSYTFDAKIILNGISDTKEIQGNLKKSKKEDLIIEGNFPISLSKFKVERPSLLFISIQDEISIRFQVTLE